MLALKHGRPLEEVRSHLAKAIHDVRSQFVGLILHVAWLAEDGAGPSKGAYAVRTTSGRQVGAVAVSVSLKMGCVCGMMLLLLPVSHGYHVCYNLNSHPGETLTLAWALRPLLQA